MSVLGISLQLLVWKSIDAKGNYEKSSNAKVVVMGEASPVAFRVAPKRAYC